MGQVHNEIRKGTLSSAVTRALGVTRLSGVERFGETLTPVQNIWGMPEWAILREERLKAQRINSSAVAGENSVVALVSPAGRNTIIVVEGVFVGPGTAMTVGMDVATDVVLAAQLATANAGPTQGRDTRVGLAGTTFIRSGSEAAVAFGQNLEVIFSSATDSKYFQFLPVVLTPGFGLAIFGFTVNTAISVGFAWRERAAYAGELV